MGNATSAEGEDVLQAQTLHAQEDGGVAEEENLLEFAAMFEPEALQKALLTIKEPPGSALSRMKEKMVKWLKGLADREESTVNMVQVVDFLTGKGVSKEEAMEFFGDVDREGEGTVNITYLLTVLSGTSSDPMQALLPCNLLPGLVDIYVDEKARLSGTGRKLVQFLLQHRVEPTKLAVPSQEQILGTFTRREELVNGRYYMYLERKNEASVMGVGEGTGGLERMSISRCYSKITVSSNSRTMGHLTDGRMDTYWQSNGSPKSHWIRIHMLPGLLVKELGVMVDSSDDSYMPKNLVVQVGNSETNLTELKALTVPRETVGKFMLVQNLGTEYRYVQINVRGCHNDGCDTRIKGLHIRGYKYSHEAEPSMLDTIVIWYLNIVASTAQAAMPVSPQLRETILTHSKSALHSLRPLSLSPHSPAKPEFLSPFVVKEMDKFLSALCIPGETFVSVDADCLHVLLCFALAHGNVNSILDCLQILMDNLALELPLVALLWRLQDINQDKLQKHAECLKLSLVKCDGGQKDDSHRPECILSNDISNNSANCYISADGKKIVNMVLREEGKLVMRVVRGVVKVQPGDQGARAGLVFLFNQDPTEGDVMERLEQYDGWGAEDYQRLQKEREDGSKSDDCTPVAYFEPDKETHEVEFTLNAVRTGQYVLLKFLGPRAEGTERVGVHTLRLFGYKSTAEQLSSTTFLQQLNTLAPLPPTSKSGTVGGDIVLMRVLSVLASLLRDLATLQARRKAASLDPSLISEPHLAVEHLSLEKIWSLYIPLTLNPDSTMHYASQLCLHLLRAALPFIKLAGNSQQPPSDILSLPSAILTHLCGLLDSPEVDTTVQRLAQDIVVEGVVVFFPDASTRREYLLSMIGAVLEDSQPRSWWLKFEALCRYFSKSDCNSLLSLPQKLQEDAEVDTSPALSILRTVMTVARREAQSCLQSGVPRPDDLLKLLCALQASLFFWCRQHLTSEEDGPNAQDTAASLLLKYVSLLSDECATLLREIDTMERTPDTLSKVLEKTLLTRTLPEMLVFLGTVAETRVDCVKLINTLHPLVTPLHSIISKLPSEFITLDSDVLKTRGDTEAIVSVWVRESPHNYENNSRINEDFVCPSATRFVIEFDSRCQTERRYDYLEFTDSNGNRHKYDDTVGSNHWPRTAEFPGSKLHFCFHSDGSNNEWGYKFTLKAMGKSVCQLGALFDLHLSLAKLLGLLCSATLSTKNARHQVASLKSEARKVEENLVHSNLWKTLFRGGYMVGKLTRSLSGAYAASPADSVLNILLQDLAHDAQTTAAPLLEVCRASSNGPYYGGPLVDRAVNAVFAALIWHSQDIREELASVSSFPGQPKLTPQLKSAFTAAEAMRRELVEARQKLLEAKEKEKDEEKKTQIDEDAPVHACHEKAVFLLKFSGLSRVATDEKQSLSSLVDRPSWVQKSKKWQKVSAAVSTVGRLKQNLQESEDKEKLSEKCPSFELVLNFVKNEALSVEIVHSILQRRSRLASTVAQACTFASEYLRSMEGSIFELPGLIFLQQLLSKQKHFPKHYAAKLDGCGLELETQVRKSYRILLLRLLEAINTISTPPSQEHRHARLLVSIYVTHFLDMQWQDYDNALLSELQLPEFLLHSAIESCSSEERIPVQQFEREEKMMERYQLHMSSLRDKYIEIKEGDRDFSELLEVPGIESKESHLFLVAMAPSSGGVVQVECDGCGTLINGKWYRDMDIDEDLDLCSTCFTRGTGSRPDAYSKEDMFQCIGGYGCDKCDMSILTHRFHSNTKQDFDLCLGCFRKEEAEGNRDEWTVYLLTEQPATATSNKFLSQETEHSMGVLYKDGMLTKLGPAMDLMVYNQHHCWVLLSSLCLTAANTINTATDTRVLEETYTAQACRIVFECLRLLAFCLRAALTAKLEEGSMKDKDKPEASQEPPTQQQQKEGEEEEEKEGEEKKEEEGEAPQLQSRVVEDQSVACTPPVSPSEEEDPLVAASKQPWEEDTSVGRMEKTFSVLAIERILGLLVATLPEELSLSRWIHYKADIEVFLAEKLLPALLHITSCQAMSESHRFMALRVAVQYMARVNPEVADRAVDVAYGRAPNEQGKTHGLKSVQHLFSAGARFLKRSNFSGAANTAECLLLLSRALPWKSAVATTIRQNLEGKPEEMDLGSIFSLLVSAGFPKLPREGSVLCKTSVEEGTTRAVLTSVTPSGGTLQGLAVDLTTRESKAVKLSEYEVQDSLGGCWEVLRLPVLVPLLKASLQLARQDSERQVEHTWILALGLKTLHRLLQTSDTKEVVEKLLSVGLVPSIVKLASKPTHFSQKWKLADLEVLGVQSYQPVAPNGSSDKETAKQEAEEGAKKLKEEEEESKEPAEPPSHSPPSDDTILEGLSSEIQEMLKMMHEAFQCRLSVLRALYEASEEDLDQFIMSSERYYDVEEQALKPPDDIMEAASKWEPSSVSAKPAPEETQGSLEDTGVTQLNPIKVDIKSLEASAEDAAIFKKSKHLIKDSSSHSQSENLSRGREDSCRLLQEQLVALKEKPASRTVLLQTYKAIVVLQARQVLASLLAHWSPEAPRLSTSFLGSIDITRYFCLLDLLLKQQSPEEGKKILSSAILCGEATEVVSLAVAAAECMGEVAVGKETVVLRPPEKDSTTETGKIVIPSATSVTVSYHPVHGKIEFSSSENFLEHCMLHTAAATNPDETLTHIIPGNTVHYKVTLESAAGAKPLKCTMTGTQKGRFETGYILLEELLCNHNQLVQCLPLGRLWPCLITRACQHTGEERLQVMKLLVRMLDTHAKSSAESAKDRLDLTALKPLWQLYSTLMKQYDDKSKIQEQMAPEIIRAFTELFFIVENLAEEWGISQDLLVETLTREGLHMWLERGISNVAYLSIALGLENAASSAFIEAKRNYVHPEKPQEVEEVDGEEEEEEDTSPSTSDTSSSDSSSSEDEEEEDEDDRCSI